MQPIIDSIKRQIDLMQDAEAGPVTLQQIAEFTGALPPETIQRLALWGELITFINSVPDVGSALIDLGDFNFGAQDIRASNFLLSLAQANITRIAAEGELQHPALGDFKLRSNNLPGAGLTFPIYEEPITAFNLVLGKPVDLFFYDLPDISFARDFEIPLLKFPPIKVKLEGEVGAEIKYDVGFDTQGLFDFGEPSSSARWRAGLRHALAGLRKSDRGDRVDRRRVDKSRIRQRRVRAKFRAHPLLRQRRGRRRHHAERARGQLDLHARGQRRHHAGAGARQCERRREAAIS